jgi:formylmethanofuran dehydrogenase subunit E
MVTENAEGLEVLMVKCNVSDRVKGYIRDCVRFHTFPAAGLLLGTFMVDLALEKLGAKPGDKLYAVSETSKCLPDALQVIVHSTQGNHRLRIIETGRYSCTMNLPSEAKDAEGVRVFVDAERVKKYHTLHKWYVNDPSYKGGVDNEALLEDILTAGTDILSSEPVKVLFSPKRKWSPVKCEKCGEMIPSDMLEGSICRACGSLRYYSNK